MKEVGVQELAELELNLAVEQVPGEAVRKGDSFISQFYHKSFINIVNK